MPGYCIQKASVNVRHSPRKLAHLQIAALAKNLSMLDSLEEDLVKAQR